MMPNIVRGGRMTGLMAYLAGPGRANEHTNPMIIAGDDRVTFAVEPGTVLSHDDAMTIGAILDQPRKVYGTEIYAATKTWDAENETYVQTGTKQAHVWHCSLSLRADEGQLSAEQWKRIAEDFVDKMGFIDPDGAKSSRWVAIHHGSSKNGNDHIHIAVQLVREDGTKARVFRDYKQAQDVCAELEVKHGLEVLEARGQGRSVSADKPAERARAQREGRSQSDRYELRRRMRAALATSGGVDQYIQRLQDLGVQVAPSFAKGSNQQIRGYKVALPDSKDANGAAIWYSPSKLDATLAWPNLAKRFGDVELPQAEARLRSLHNSNQTAPAQQKFHNFDPQLTAQLIAGTRPTGPDTLASVYARLSVQLEQDQPGALWGLSEQFARAAQRQGNATYAVRSAAKNTARFAAGKGHGWAAVLKQANRVSRVMNTTRIAPQRPKLAHNIQSFLNGVTALERSAVATTQPAQPMRRPHQGRTMERDGLER
jgi:hypothetical protein